MTHSEQLAEIGQLLDDLFIEKVINELESELGSYLSEGDTKWV